MGDCIATCVSGSAWWPTAAGILSAAWFGLSLVNGKLSGPARSKVGKLLDLLSWVARHDASGSVKPPGKRSSHRLSDTVKP